MKTMKTTLLLLQLVLFSSLGLSQEYFGTTTFGDLGIDSANNSVIDSQGRIFTGGLFQSSITLGPDTITSAGGNADGYVTIHDNDGTPVGVLQFGGGFDDVVIDLAVDANDNLYITGYFQGANVNNPFDADPGPGVVPLLQPAMGLSRDIFVIKLDSDQQFVWAKQVSNPFGFGPINEDAQTIDVDSAGNVYIGGSFRLADFDPDPAVDNTVFSADGGSSADGFLLKLDTDGNFVWVKTYEGPGGIVEVESLQLDANGDLIATGRYRNQVDLDPGAATDIYNSNGSDDVFVTKIDSDGNYIWGHVFGGAGLDIINTITEINSEIYIGGAFAGTADLDPGAGDNTVTSNGDFDTFFSKFDTDGTYVSSYVTGGETTSLEDVYRITEGPNGDLFISGSFAGTSDFDAGTGTASSTSNGGRDNFFVQLTPDVSYVNSWIIGGADDDDSPQVLFNNAGEIISIGMFRDSVDFNPFDGDDTQTSVASYDVYVSRYFPFDNGNDACTGAIAVVCGDTIAGETIFDTDSGGNAAPDEFFSYTGTGALELVTISLCNGGTDFDSVIRIYDDCDLANEIAMNDDSCGTQSEVAFVSDGSSTYYIMIEGNGTASGNFSMDVACQELPENDFCDGALPISCGETLTGSTDEATFDASAPVCTTDITAPGVWYVFNDTSGLVTDYTLSLCDGGTNFDSKITVYTGDCGNLVCEIDNDDSCDLQSEVSFQGDGNTTYYILVHGFSDNTGDFSLNLDCVPVPPVNDRIANSIDVDEIGVPYTDVAVPMPGATTEAGTPAGCDNAGVQGVWYNFTPLSGGEITATVVAPMGYTSVTFYTAPNENAVETDLTLVDYFNNQCVPGETASIPVVAGQAYYVYVANTEGITDIVIDGDALLDTTDATLQSFSLYPNPASNSVNLDAGANNIIENVTVFSILGQEVLRETPNSNQTTLQVSHLTQGTYLVEVQINGETGIYKMVKQ